MDSPDAEKAANRPSDDFGKTATNPADSQHEKRTLLKLDLLLIPAMSILYLLAFLDRTNIGNARVAGLQEDLGMSAYQYSTAITVTYVPYIAAELPSNLLLNKIGPRILLPAICVLWGVVSTLQSQVSSYSGLLAVRFFLGLVEGGLFPGIVLYLSGFYRRHELQVRVGLFFSAAAVSGAFSGLLAAAIIQMDGLRGMRGWQWVFLLEGVFTVCYGFVIAAFLPNTPRDVTLFTPEEKEHCIKRLETDGPAKESGEFNLKAMLSTFRSLHIWILCLAIFANGVGVFGLANFTPSIVQSFGYTGARTQLLTVPPFVLAFIATMISAPLADRYRARGLTAIITSIPAIAGFSLFLARSSLGARYTALCLMIMGVYSTTPSLVSWVPNNTATRTRRSTAVAMAFVSSNSGGILSTWIYPDEDAPDYKLAAGLTLAFMVVVVFAAAGEVGLLRWLNRRKREEGWRNRVLGGVEGLGVQREYEVLGDGHPDFEYTL